MDSTRDTRDDGGSALRAWLFVAVLLFFFIGLSPFPDLDAASQADPQNGGSNPLNQVAALALTLGLAVYGARHPLWRVAAFQPRILLMSLFLWLAAASAMAAIPDVALRKVVLAAATCFNASVMLLLPRSSRHLAKLLLIATATMLAVAYAGVVFWPLRAIHQATELIEPEHAGLWHGQFSHKNEAAAIMVVAFLIGLFTYRAGYRAISLGVMVLSAVFLLHTGGKSAIGYLPLTLAVAWVFERWRWSRLLIALGAPILFNAVDIGCTESEAVSKFVESLGIDPTFTGRTVIWRLALDAIAQRPIFGYGYQGFWQSDDLFYRRGTDQTWAVQAFNSHNTWIEMAITAGLPWVALAVPWLVILPMRNFARAEASGNDPALSRLFLRIWLYGLFQSYVEALFFQNGSPLWFLFMLSLFGLRLQARARVRGEAPEPRAGSGPVGFDATRPPFDVPARV